MKCNLHNNSASKLTINANQNKHPDVNKPNNRIRMVGCLSQTGYKSTEWLRPVWAEIFLCRDIEKHSVAIHKTADVLAALKDEQTDKQNERLERD